MYLKFCRKMALMGSLVAILAACSADSSAPAGDAAQQSAANDGKTILVCSEAAYPPFEFRDKDGLVAGYGSDVFNAIGKDQGFKPAFVIRRWDDLFPALNKGECDVVAATLTITDERRRDYEMSMPYGRTTSVVMYVDDGGSPKTVNDLSNMKVATQPETYAEEYLRKHGVNNFVMQSSTYLALKAMIKGEAQAAIGDGEVLAYYLRQDPTIKVNPSSSIGALTFSVTDKNGHSHTYRTLDLKLPADQNGLGFLMKKGNTKLLQKVNTGLAHIKTNGTLAELQKKWLGTVQKLPTGQNTDTPAASAE